MRLRLVTLLTVLFVVPWHAFASVRHDVTVVVEPEDGAVTVTHSLEIEAGKGATLVLPDRMTVRSATLNGRPMPASAQGRRIEIGPVAGGAARVVMTYDARPWPGSETRGAFVGPPGAFLPAGSGWLATVADTDHSYRLAIEVPLPYRAVVTGRLIDETEANGRYLAVFQSETPLEPPSLFVGQFVVGERIHEGLRLRTYFPASHTSLWPTYLDAAAEHIVRLAGQIGPYPFAGFAIVASPQPVGLGFPGLTYVSERILPLPFMRWRSLAHEVAHNWWGNGVGVDYATGNWAEGLTTFMADYGLAEAAGPDRASAMRLEWLRDFAALPAARDLPLRQFVYKAHDAAQVVGYNKAAFLFVMLRDLLGEDDFYVGLRLFWQRKQFQTASWDDLRLALESAAGADLYWFFTQWLDRAGAPSLALGSAEIVAGTDGDTVSVLLAQSSPHYDLQVPIRIETEQDSAGHRVRLAAAEGHARLATSGRPRTVALDPDHELFRRLTPGEAPPILRDVTFAANGALRIEVGEDTPAQSAAQALAGRLVDAGLHEVTDMSTGPVLLIGLDHRLDQALDELNAGPVPDSLAGRGTARVWTVRREGAGPILVVAARDTAALEALQRPLPHYKRQSFLVFEGSRAIERGVWPADSRALTATLE